MQKTVLYDLMASSCPACTIYILHKDIEQWPSHYQPDSRCTNASNRQHQATYASFFWDWEINQSIMTLSSTESARRLRFSMKCSENSFDTEDELWCVFINFIRADAHKNYSYMNNIAFDIRSNMSSATTNKISSKVSLRIASMRAKQLRNQTVKRCRGIRQPLWHKQPLPVHTTRSTDRCKRNVTPSYQEMVVTYRLSQVRYTWYSLSYRSGAHPAWLTTL